MDILNASAMGMMFNKVNLDDLLGGDLEKLSQAQEEIAGQLGNAAALIGSLPAANACSNGGPLSPGCALYDLRWQFAMQPRDKIAN